MDNDYEASRINVIDLSTKSLPEIIREIERRPLMWLPEKHIMYFSTFLDGYLHTSNDPDAHFIIKCFNVFIDNKYSIRTTHGWARNINHMSANPHDALDKFFKEFKEFIERHEL
ncbi:hypothetical protein [Sessilibacter corallicola]|uniref:hypothetical protein n=1 Tax=Sessilibacter corallicola TaxID=2904075 RepID=UPI001E2DFD9F|nr:hypothetical protein [Sessilibacter corallicola]MCE2027335.1 hypothetical protein [Sessilibacter corallicola]